MMHMAFSNTRTISADQLLDLAQHLSAICSAVHRLGGYDAGVCPEVPVVHVHLCPHRNLHRLQKVLLPESCFKLLSLELRNLLPRHAQDLQGSIVKSCHPGAVPEI